MDLQKYIDSLTKEKQFDIALRFIRLVLPVWDKYASENELSYRDTVVGLKHHVDRNLLINTIDQIEAHLLENTGKSKDLLQSFKQFEDPIVSLQDMDWELPFDVETVFYAVFNLLDAAIYQGKTFGGESLIYVAINRIIDLLDRSKIITIEEIKQILYS